MYRLEQPPIPDDLRTRHGARQQRVLPSAMGVSPIQRPSPGRMLPSPMRRAATDICSIFVGGLPPHATQERLREMFQVYGQTLHIELIQKPSVNSMSSSSLSFPHEMSLIVPSRRFQYLRLHRISVSGYGHRCRSGESQNVRERSSSR